jgi:hypothetical protein
MKFQKQLTDICQTFTTPLLAQTCIPYKQWKKTIKYQKYDWSLADLERQCKSVDAVFYNEYQRIYSKKESTPRRWFHICQEPSDPYKTRAITPKELLTYAEINAQAVYKVCKKLEKTKKTPGAMKFLEYIRRRHTFDFLGSDHTTRLRLEIPESSVERECPICFEDLEPAVVLPCGHYQCFKCLCQMTPYHKIPATFSNRLNIISQTFHCPFCRFHFCSKTLGIESFWPAPPDDAKKGYLAPVKM